MKTERDGKEVRTERDGKEVKTERDGKHAEARIGRAPVRRGRLAWRVSGRVGRRAWRVGHVGGVGWASGRVDGRSVDGRGVSGLGALNSWVLLERFLPGRGGVFPSCDAFQRGWCDSNGPRAP